MDENGNSSVLGEDLGEYEDWSDIDTSNLVEEADGDEAPEETGEDTDAADQPEDGEQPGTEGEDKPEDGKGAEGEQKPQESDQTFELKHLDETRTVNREEVIALAQKGMDYDRIRGKLDELRGLEAQASQNSAYAEFVQELAKNAGISPEELMDSTRAQVLMGKTQGLSKEAALEQAKQTREARNQSEQQSREMREQQHRQEKFREEVSRFVGLHPDVKAEDIPAEVWQDYDRNGNLTDAWQKHENRKLAEENARLSRELEELKQDKKNDERSTGSRKSAGASAKSSVDRAWEEALRSEL